MEWLAILGLGAVAAIATAIDLVSTSLGITITLLGLTATVLVDLVKANRHNDGDLRPIGLAAIVGAQLMTLLSFILPSGIGLGIVVVSAILCTAGVMQIAVHRMGIRPDITVREIAIVSAALGLMFFLLIVEPNIDDGTGEMLRAVVSSTAVGIAMFAMFLAYWFVGFDKSSVSMPLLLTLVGPTMLVLVIGNRAGSFEQSTAYLFAILGAVATVAAAVHSECADAFSPALITNSEMDTRRSLISFSVVLVGPVLIGIDQLTSLQLSLPIVTIGSSALSLAVAFHLLGMVKRWAQVEHQGQHDPLTNLPNRPLFFGRLEMAIESARLRDSRFVVMFLDLDRFKAVNDTLGHDAGDELLRQVAVRLHEASLRVGPNLTVSRLGGDEFAILVPAVKDVRHSHAIGRLFLDQFLDPFDVGLRDIYVTPSIGLAEFPKDGGTVEELIENADTAMFEAKERGRNMVVSYSPEQRVPGAHRLEIEAALHRALENRELELYYQPQVDISTGQIFAVEALLRWEHPTLGMISPEKFVPVAEESSLIDTIGEWILIEACTTAARWSDIGLPAINVAVNLSPRQFQKAVHLTDNVSQALRISGLPPGRLELELTESLALEKPEQVNATLSRFREMGIRTAIDDFGVGHTGLDYLDRIEVDTLKIDRSFINRIGESGAPLVTAVISLARGLNLDVIAEGVETRAQVNFLKSHGCRYMQGYLFSKPLTGEQLERVLRNQKDRQAASPADQVAGQTGHTAGQPAADPAATPASAPVAAPVTASLTPPPIPQPFIELPTETDEAA